MFHLNIKKYSRLILYSGIVYFGIMTLRRKEGREGWEARRKEKEGDIRRKNGGKEEGEAWMLVGRRRKRG